MYLYSKVGFIFEGGVHCKECTSKRFPKLKGIDREGNLIGVYTVDDASNADHDTACDDCHDTLYEVEE